MKVILHMKATLSCLKGKGALIENKRPYALLVIRTHPQPCPALNQHKPPLTCPLINSLTKRLKLKAELIIRHIQPPLRGLM
jgi:hypothetical protein